MESLSNVSLILALAGLGWIVFTYLGDFNCWLEEKLEPGYRGVMARDGIFSSFLFLTFGFLAFLPKILAIFLCWLGLFLGYCGWFGFVSAMFCRDKISETVFDKPISLKRSLWLMPLIVAGTVPATLFFLTLVIISLVLLYLGGGIKTLDGEGEDAYY